MAAPVTNYERFVAQRSVAREQSVCGHAGLVQNDKVVVDHFPAGRDRSFGGVECDQCPA
jgi:hypothetical protein